MLVILSVNNCLVRLFCQVIVYILLEQSALNLPFVINNNIFFPLRLKIPSSRVGLHLQFNFSLYFLIQSILWPYGACLGLWLRENFSHYGNVTQCVFDGIDGWKLRIITWEAPPGNQIFKFNYPIFGSPIVMHSVSHAPKF